MKITKAHTVFRLIVNSSQLGPKSTQQYRSKNYSIFCYSVSLLRFQNAYILMIFLGPNRMRITFHVNISVLHSTFIDCENFN